MNYYVELLFSYTHCICIEEPFAVFIDFGWDILNVFGGGKKDE